MEVMKRKLCSVKLWMAVLILAIGTTLCVLGFLDGSQWVTCATLVYGGFAASNVASKGKSFLLDGSGGQPVVGMES